MYLKKISILFGLLILGACSDNDSVPQQQIVVSASLGQFTDADVTITRPDGSEVTGGTGTTGSDGTTTLSIPASTPSPIVVTVSGNARSRYFDEANGVEIEFPASRRIRAYSRSSRSSVGVTTLTELASQVADQVGTGVTEAEIDSINESVRMMFAPDVSDILMPPTLVNSNNINSQSLGTDEASLYALRLAALAGLGAGSDAPALTILSQLSEDLSDGVIDGRGTNGTIENVSYDNFAEAFTAAIQLASTTLADTDLLASLDNVTVSTGANILQQLIDGGLELPSTVTDNISTGGSGSFDLTITGNVSAAGISTPFNVTLPGVPAPDPGDTAAITETINSSVAGLSGIAGLNVAIVNNTSSQVTFDVELTAQQSGVSVSLDLRYDYVANGNNSSNGGIGSGGTGTDGSTGGAGGGGSTGNICRTGTSSPATIPEVLTASVRTLTFTSAQPGAPFSEGDQKEFTFSSSGRLFIDNTEVAANPVLCNGNDREAIWKDNDEDLTYAASDLLGSFNEVNVNKASDGTFFGQFKELTEEETGPPSVLTDLAGTFETRVVESCTGDTCPNTTPVGEIVTVVIGTDGTVTFGEKEFSTQVTDATFSDRTENTGQPRLSISNPGTNEGDTFRLELYLDAGAFVAIDLTQSVSCGSGCSQSRNIYTEVTSIPADVVAFFDKFISLMPATFTVVADVENQSGDATNFTRTQSPASPLCKEFEISAEKDRAAVASDRFRPAFSYFSGNRGGGNYQAKTSKYKKDDATGDEILSLGFSQLVLRADGTIDLQEGNKDPATGFIEEVKDSSTTDATEIASVCANFHKVGGTVTSTSGGSLTLQLTDGTSETIIESTSITLSTDAGVDFSFTLQKDATYKIQKGFSSPSGLECTFTNETGTVGDDDVTNIGVSCS